MAAPLLRHNGSSSSSSECIDTDAIKCYNFERYVVMPYIVSLIKSWRRYKDQ